MVSDRDFAFVTSRPWPLMARIGHRLANCLELDLFGHI
jgi:hypothetical protein